MDPQLRIEKRPSASGDKYYLVKDIRVGKKGTKVSRLIKTGSPPTPEEEYAAKETHGPDILEQAVNKYGELRSQTLKYAYIPKSIGREIEKIRYIHKILQDTLTSHELEEYEKNSEYQYVHGTTSIEGNTLDLRETKQLLNDNIAPDNKLLREINEVQNFRLVKKYRDASKKPVTIEFILKIHQLIMTNIDIEMAGVFRRSNAIGIVGYDGLLPPADIIEESLQGIIDEYYRKVSEGYCPFEQAVLFHHRFECIHPFNDGNGRTGREIFNYLLIRDKFPRMFFISENFRKQYLDALNRGDKENYAGMVALFASMIIKQHKNVMERMVEQTTQKPQ
ncbi:hypothetical protein SDC9_23517 [bioreactor metagenome]|uniref:Fido domain-containing protein n=1 Tax=bioreactor metagenome TaxID=1076179 RepID=A0A644UFJ3_9ZZZZ